MNIGIWWIASCCWSREQRTQAWELAIGTVAGNVCTMEMLQRSADSGDALAFNGGVVDELRGTIVELRSALASSHARNFKLAQEKRSIIAETQAKDQSIQQLVSLLAQQSLGQSEGAAAERLVLESQQAGQEASQRQQQAMIVDEVEKDDELLTSPLLQPLHQAKVIKYVHIMAPLASPQLRANTSRLAPRALVHVRYIHMAAGVRLIVEGESVT